MLSLNYAVLPEKSRPYMVIFHAGPGNYSDITPLPVSYTHLTLPTNSLV